MIYAFILSFLAALALSYAEIRDIILVLFASPVKDDVFAADSIEKCTGIVEEDTTHSPLEQASCALWQIKVDVHKGGKYENKRTIFEDSSIAPFFIRTGQARVQIRPMNASLSLNEERARKWEVGSWGRVVQNKEAEAHILDSVKQMGAMFTAQDESTGVRVTETRLSSGDKVFVIGRIDFKDGVKSLSVDENNLLLISEMDEQTYIGRLYGKIAYKFSIVIFFGLFLYGWLFFL